MIGKWLPLVIVATALSSCGYDAHSSRINGQAEHDIASKKFRDLFKTALTMTDGNLEELQLNKNYNCIRLLGFKDVVNQSQAVRRFSKVAGFIKSTTNSTDVSDMEALSIVTDTGLITQFTNPGGDSASEKIEIYTRVLPDKRIAEEWTVSGNQMVKEHVPPQGIRMTVAKYVLDQSQVNPNQYILHYAICE